MEPRNQSGKESLSATTAKQDWEYQANLELKILNKVFTNPLDYIDAFNRLDWAESNEDAKKFLAQYKKQQGDIERKELEAFKQKHTENNRLTYTPEERNKFENDVVHTQAYIGRMDFTGYEKKTQIAVSQVWGTKSWEQQDTFATGELENFSKLNKAQKEQFLLQQFAHLEESIEDNYKKESVGSGTTLCSVVIDGNNVYASSLGDSVAYAAIMDDKNNVVDLIQLNKLHKPSDPAEQDYILKNMDPNISEQERKMILANMGYESNPRLYDLGVTGALGDTNLNKYGIRHQPENVTVTSLKIPPGGKAVVIVASDGITERQDKDKILAAIQNGPHANAKEIASTITKSAFNSGAVDNTTVLAKEVDPQSNKITYMSVFDGHGRHGYKISHHVAKIYDQILQRQLKILLKTDEMMRLIKQEVYGNRELWQQEASKPAAIISKKLNQLVNFKLFSGKESQSSADKLYPSEVAKILSLFERMGEPENHIAPINMLQSIKKIADEAVQSFRKDIPANKSPSAQLTELYAKSPEKAFMFLVSKSLEGLKRDPILAETMLQTMLADWQKLTSARSEKRMELP